MKLLAKRLLRALGYDLHHYWPRSSTDAQFRRIVEFLEIDLVIDVGANRGDYGTGLRFDGYRGRILSVEPLADAYALLERAARGDASWTVLPRCAVGDAAGEADLRVAANSESSSLLPMLDSHVRAAPGSHAVRTERVPVRRIDEVAADAVSAARQVLLKVDTQGYEAQVLRGASGIMPRVVALQLELSLVPLYAGQALYKEMLAMTESLGFELYAVRPAFVDERTGRTLQIDGLFVRGTVPALGPSVPGEV